MLRNFFKMVVAVAAVSMVLLSCSENGTNPMSVDKTNNTNSVSRGPGTAWCVNNAGVLFRYENGTWVFKRVNGNKWNAMDVGVSPDGTVWVISKEAAPGGYLVYKSVDGGASWEKPYTNNGVPGAGIHIDGSINGTAFLVNDVQTTFKYINGVWEQKSFKFYDIGVCDDGIAWAVGEGVASDGSGLNTWKAASINGVNWLCKYGGAMRIAGGRNYWQAWSVNFFHQLLYFDNGYWSRVLINGQDNAGDVSQGSDGTVWLVSNEYVPGGCKIYKRLPNGTWEFTNGAAIAISVQ